MTSVSLSRSLETLLMIVAHARKRVFNLMAPCHLERWGTEPSVRPGRVTEREQQGPSPLSPCLRAHPLNTTDTLPQSSPSANEISTANKSHLVV